MLDDTVWAPSLHMSEGSRWDYRVVITRALSDSASDERTIATDSYRDKAEESCLFGPAELTGPQMPPNQEI